MRVNPPLVLSLSKDPLPSMSDAAPYPLMGEGWGEGNPPARPEPVEGHLPINVGCGPLSLDGRGLGEGDTRAAIFHCKGRQRRGSPVPSLEP